VAGNAAWRGELAKHEPQAIFVVRDLRMNLGVRTLKIGAGIQ
jgi:hypothetical protein